MPKDDKHSDTDLPTGADAEAAVRGWLAAFDAALSASDAGSAAALFIDDGHWRDVLAFDWDLATTSGRDAISARLSEVLAGVSPRNFRLNEDRYPPRPVMRAGVNCLEAFVQFESEGGQCEGVVRLVPAGYDPFAVLRRKLRWTEGPALDGAPDPEAIRDEAVLDGRES